MESIEKAFVEPTSWCSRTRVAPQEPAHNAGASRLRADDNAPVQVSLFKQPAAGDALVEQMLVDVFLAETESRIMAIDTALLEFKQDVEALERTTASVGATRANALARTLRQISNGGDLARAYDALDRLRAEFETLRNYLRSQVPPEQELRS
jgi:hypothetical protein